MLRTNFGQNIRLTPQFFYTPENEQEVLQILSQHRGQKIRCSGRLHSWSKAIEAEEVLLDLRRLDQVIPEPERASPSAVVGAGCQVKRLLEQLQRAHGWTLPSVGFITEQTIVGAISTGTHGSGRHSLSHYVLAVRLARYDADTGEPVIEEIDSGDALRAARCSLGSLGVILSVRMQCRSAYAIEEHFREYGRLEDVVAAEDEYPQQQFFLAPWRWTYFAQHRRETAQRKSKTRWLYQAYRFITFDIAMHLLILLTVRLLRSDASVRGMLRWLVPMFVVRNWRVVGSSDSQLVMEHELFRHVEIELFVQKSQLAAAMRFLRQALTIAGSPTSLSDQQALREVTPADCAEDLQRLIGSYCHHYPICVRKVLVDDTLISMASPGSHTPKRDAVRASLATGELSAEAIQSPAEDSWYSITLTNYQRGRQREPFERLASFLARSMATLYGARPHWGKLCPLSPAELRRLYPEFSTFQEICQQLDPQQAFANRWTQSLFAKESPTCA